LHLIREWFSNKVIGNDLNSIMKDLVTLDLEEFKEKFKIFVMQMFSYMDVGGDFTILQKWYLHLMAKKQK